MTRQRFCSECGAQLASGARFCGSCGKNVTSTGDAERATDRPLPAPERPTPATVDTRSGPPEDRQPAVRLADEQSATTGAGSRASRRRRTRVAVIIGSAVALLIAAGIVATIVVSSSSSAPTRASPLSGGGPSDTVTTLTIPKAHAVAVDPGAHTAYVTNSTTMVFAIDTVTNEVTPINVGDKASEVAVDSTSHAAFFTNYSETGAVTVVDTHTNRVTGKITSIGSYPSFVAAFQGEALYVSTGNGLVSINIASGRVFRTLDLGIGKNTRGLTIDPTTHLTYLCSDGGVTVIDISGGLQATIAVAGPLGVAVDSGTHTAYVTTDAGVSVIDTATNQVIDALPIGAGEFGVAVDPGTHTAYVSTRDGLAVIDTTTHHVKNTVSVKANSGVAVNPETHTVYVTDEHANSVSVVR